MDVPGKKLPDDLPEYLRTCVAPEVPDCLRPAFLTAVEHSQIRTMQNSQVYAQPLHQPGVCVHRWQSGGEGMGGAGQARGVGSNGSSKASQILM